jgi:hypothetical protein
MSRVSKGYGWKHKVADIIPSLSYSKKRLGKDKKGGAEKRQRLV